MATGGAASVTSDGAVSLPNASGGGADRQAVQRVVLVLESLAASGGEGVDLRELAVRLGISRRALARMLDQLNVLGVAAARPGRRYGAGTAALAWSALLAGRHTLAWVAQDALASLVRQFDEAAYAVSYDAELGDIVFVEGSASTRPIRYVAQLQSRAPLHAGAAGKAVMAHLDEAVRDLVHLERVTPATITDPDRLLEDLESVRRNGYATSVGERIDEAAGVAAPVFQRGSVVGAITMTIPRYRMDPAAFPTYGAAVASAAAEVTALLTPPPPRRESAETDAAQSAEYGAS